MERNLCNECQLENFCKYEGYIHETIKRVKNSLDPKEIQEAMATVDYLKYRARTKSDPCKRFDKFETLNASSPILNKNEGQNSESSAKQTSS